MDQALNSQKTPHTSPLRASYGMSFVSILMKNDRVIKGFYCTYTHVQACHHCSSRFCACLFQVISQMLYPVAKLQGQTEYNDLMSYQRDTRKLSESEDPIAAALLEYGEARMQILNKLKKVRMINFMSSIL